eukprot:1588464-Rhodomonas_salina.5
MVYFHTIMPHTAACRETQLLKTAALILEQVMGVYPRGGLPARVQFPHSPTPFPEGHAQALVLWHLKKLAAFVADL